MQRSRFGLVGLLAAVLISACSAAAGPDTAAGPPAGPTEPTARAAADAATQPAVSPGVATPEPTLPSVPTLVAPAHASRVVVEELGIDLPVISGDLQPPPNYPLCDVAAYVTRFSQPYEEGVTYISAHAQKGMFLPLLEASRKDDGAGLIGLRVDVYTDDGIRYGYRIESVRRHATDYAVVNELDLLARTLILQTSEGPYGTLEKLQVVAVPLDEARVDVSEAAPEPQPRDCRPPELVAGATPTPEPTPASIDVTAPTPPPGTTPAAVATPTSGATGSPAPGSSTPEASPVGGFVERAVASRIVVPAQGIDLPVVSGDLRPPPSYPFCDVAAYVTFLAQPEETGTTYISAHAQPGMFLPLLEASRRRDGREMLGMAVDVYTTDARRYRYEVWQVRRHITDRSIASDDLQPGEHRLVLQTSEGAYGTKEKLALAARLIEITGADPAEAAPEARPRDCTPEAALDARP